MLTAIKILILSSMFYSLSAGLLGPIYAIFVEEVGGNILTASTAIAVYTFVIGLLVIIFGKIEERLNRTKMLILGRILTIVGTAGWLFVTSPVHIFLVQIILGVANAVKNPSWNAMFSRYLERGKETSEWGLVEGADSMVYAGAALVGGIVATLFGFRSLFVLMTVFAVVSFVITLYLVRKKGWKMFLGI